MSAPAAEAGSPVCGQHAKQEEAAMTDKELLLRVYSREDAERIFASDASVRAEFPDPGALHGYVAGLRSGRVRVAGRGRVGAGTK